ncbi:MAG: hypothetical protein IANPNBLG_02259 [Bryobacteraceae bacterium]|nr:hypothetical protein [Bryobacteraceae bacterium]
MNRLLAIVALLSQAAIGNAEWTGPVEVQHDGKRCLTYRARWSGDYVVVETAIEPGWHTFAMDNKQRQAEKLAGKPSLGIERPTEIRFVDGLEAEGGWLQSEPKDFSKPDIRWYTWGFDTRALFAAKTKQRAAGRIAIRGQACTESICKNIDVSIALPAPASGSSGMDLKSLIPVRQ